MEEATDIAVYIFCIILILTDNSGSSNANIGIAMLVVKYASLVGIVVDDVSFLSAFIKVPPQNPHELFCLEG